MIQTPSDEDMEFVLGCLTEYELQLELGCVESPKTARVIAHLARNLKVLAEICRPENRFKTLTLEESIALNKKRDAAIQLADSIEIGGE